MKMNLSAAASTALFVFALSALAGANAMGATSGTGNASPVHVLALPYKLQCAGFGEKQVSIQNVGHGPVPAGTAVQWQLPKEVHLISGSNFTFPAQSGIYTFQSPLNPGGQVGINVPPPSSGQGGVAPDPSTILLVATFLRSCTIGPAPSNYQRMMPH